jgi:hypothetical protein
MAIPWKSWLLLIPTGVTPLSIVRARQSIVEVKAVLDGWCSYRMLWYLRLIFVKSIASEVLEVSSACVTLSCNYGLDISGHYLLIGCVCLTVKRCVDSIRDSRLLVLLWYELIGLYLRSMDLLGW